MPLDKWLGFSANSTQIVKNQYISNHKMNVWESGTSLAQIKKLTYLFSR